MKKTTIIVLLLLIDFLNAAQLSQGSGFKYIEGDTIKIHFQQMEAKNKDWIAIYPKGSDNSWKNVIAWRWTKDKSYGIINFGKLPKGNYEARAFYNNSYQVEAALPFEIEARKDSNTIVFKQEDRTSIKFKYRKGAKIENSDWMAIYKLNDSNAWGNVIKWAWVKDLKENTFHFDGDFFGDYEIRFFRNNSFTVDSKSFFDPRYDF